MKTTLQLTKKVVCLGVALMIIFTTLCTQIVSASSTNNLYRGNLCLMGSFFIDDNTYQTIKGEKIVLTDESASDWFNQNFEPICKFKWIIDPKSPISLGDFLLLIFNIQISAEPNKSYPRREIEYEDLDDYFNLVNMVEVLSGTGTWNDPSILSGTPTETGVRLNFDDYITRAQVSKIIDTACHDWYNLEKVRKTVKFSDIDNSWANENIINAYEYGFVNGKDNNRFEPDSYLSIEEALTILYNIMMSNNTYTINDFVTAVNYSDVSKIIEVSTSDFTGTLATKPHNVPYYYNEYIVEGPWFFTSEDFPQKDTVKYLDNTLYAYYDSDSGLRIIDNIYNYLTGRIGPITIIPPDVQGIDLQENGKIYFSSEAQPGEYTFTIINEYGNQEYLTLKFYSKPTDLTLKKEKPNESLWFNGDLNIVKNIGGNRVILDVNESVDLNEYLKNVSGKWHIYCDNPKYTTFDGISKITLVKKPPLIDKYNYSDYDKIYISDDYTTVILYIP